MRNDYYHRMALCFGFAGAQAAYDELLGRVIRDSLLIHHSCQMQSELSQAGRAIDDLRSKIGDLT